MERFLSLTFLFMIGSSIGWIIELFFRRIVHKTWINPGFLKGPYLPLYGLGLTLLYCIAIIPLESIISQVWLIILVKIFLVGISMTLIELIAGLIFIKGMNIQLWDYSNRKGNFEGIICPLFSFFWTLIGGGYVVFVHPLIIDAVIWFTNNIYYSFFVGIFFGLMIFDLITSLNVAFKIKRFTEEHQIIIKYESLKEHLKNKAKTMKNRVNFLSPFSELHKLIQEKEIAPSFLSKLKKKIRKEK